MRQKNWFECTLGSGESNLRKVKARKKEIMMNRGYGSVNILSRGCGSGITRKRGCRRWNIRTRGGGRWKKWESHDVEVWKSIYRGVLKWIC